MSKNKVLVTGGAGFIGSNFLTWIIKSGNTRIVNYDKLTYAGNLDTLHSVENDPNYFFVEGDICNQELVRKTLVENEVDSIVNFAAESHVDRSIESPDDFIQTNIVGTFRLLQASRDYWNGLKEKKKIPPQKFSFLWRKKTPREIFENPEFWVLGGAIKSNNTGNVTMYNFSRFFLWSVFADCIYFFIVSHCLKQQYIHLFSYNPIYN